MKKLIAAFLLTAGVAWGADAPPPSDYDLGKQAGVLIARMQMIEAEYKQLQEALAKIDAQRTAQDTKADKPDAQAKAAVKK